MSWVDGWGGWVGRWMTSWVGGWGSSWVGRRVQEWSLERRGRGRVRPVRRAFPVPPRIQQGPTGRRWCLSCLDKVQRFREDGRSCRGPICVPPATPRSPLPITTGPRPTSHPLPKVCGQSCLTGEGASPIPLPTSDSSEAAASSKMKYPFMQACFHLASLNHTFPTTIPIMKNDIISQAHRLVLSESGPQQVRMEGAPESQSGAPRRELPPATTSERL